MIESVFNEHHALIIPTWPPASILKEWSQRYYAKRDFTRGKEWLEGKRNKPSENFLIQPSFREARDWLLSVHTKLQDGPLKLVEDVETRNGFMTCIGFATSREDSLCIPFTWKDGREYFTSEERAELSSIIIQIHSSPNLRLIGQNFLYDLAYLNNEFLGQPIPWMDTMLAYHAMWPGQPKSLDMLSSLFCEWHVFWKEENKEAETRADDLMAWRYNCKDTVATFEVAEVLEKLLPKRNALHVHEFLHALYEPVLSMVNVAVT